MKNFINNIMRALRLPFTLASLMPFISGSLAIKGFFDATNFVLGLITVMAGHLSANLINDYADSKTGVDWQDTKFYRYFGGSKLIQESVFSGRFYFYLALLMAAISCLSALVIAIIQKNIFIIAVFFGVLFLAWSYSAKPLQFSYRRYGEIIIFILFGPAPVMGGYFLQGGQVPDLKSFILSLPFGFIATAILYANEIPDFKDDIRSGKFTWVSIIGQKRAYILYLVLMVCAFLSIVLNIICGYMGLPAIVSLFAVSGAMKAAGILKSHWHDKVKLIESSRLTITIHSVVSLLIIIGVIFG